MFEEVPVSRHGVARLTGRRIALGPFVVGGGVLLAAFGGSVAVAATVITASTIGFNDPPPRHASKVAVMSTSTTAKPKGSPTTTTGHGKSATSAALSHTLAHTPSGPSTGGIAPSVSPIAPDGGPLQASALPAPSVSTSAMSGLAPSSSTSGPAGNAVVYVTGYDRNSNRIEFSFATVRHGAGPNGSDLYARSSHATFRAGLPAGISIVSGTTLCPPVGRNCTNAELIASAGSGFFAEVAIDAQGNLRSVIERDNVGASSSTDAAPAASPSGTTAPNSPGAGGAATAGKAGSAGAATAGSATAGSAASASNAGN